MRLAAGIAASSGAVEEHGNNVEMRVDGDSSVVRSRIITFRKIAPLSLTAACARANRAFAPGTPDFAFMTSATQGNPAAKHYPPSLAVVKSLRDVSARKYTQIKERMQTPII